MALFAASTDSFSQTNSFPFQSGENMHLVIHYKWGFSADIADISFTFNEIKEKGKDPYFHLVANASTYKFWDSFFKVRDLYESKFSSKDLKPMYFHRDVFEGGFTAKNWYTWSDDAMSMRAIVDKKGRPRRDTTFAEGVVIRDIINVFYYMRTIDFDALQKGKRVQFTAAIDRNVIDVTIRFDKKEVKKISELGSFNAIKVAVAVKPRQMDHKNGKGEDDRSMFSVTESSSTEEEGIFYGEEKIFVWFSDDANKLPLYFSAPVAVGSINGRISQYANVKNPVTSLVKGK